MVTFKVFKTESCPYCQSAMQFLAALKKQHPDVSVKLIDGNKDRAKLQAALRRAKSSTVPQIWVDQHHIGGWDQLSGWAGSGGLDKYLETGEFSMPRRQGFFKKLFGRTA